MKQLKNYAIALLYVLIPFLLLSFIMTILSYFNILNYKIANIISLIIPVLSIFIGGINIGKKSHNKGWFNGFKIGIIYLLIIIILNIFIKTNYQLSTFFYYSIILVAACLGGMIGISSKSLENKN